MSGGLTLVAVEDDIMNKLVEDNRDNAHQDFHDQRRGAQPNAASRTAGLESLELSENRYTRKRRFRKAIVIVIRSDWWPLRRIGGYI